jgi:hypothetical protein
VLVRPHDGSVNHGVFIVGIHHQGLQDTLPHTAPAPAHVTQMDHPKVAKAFGQVASRDAGAVAVEHGMDKQPVVLCWRSYRAGPAGQQVFDAFPLGVC